MSKEKSIKYSHIKNISEVRDYLRETGVRHTVIQTANTTKIQSLKGNYVGYTMYLRKKDLTLITRVKKEIEKNNITYNKRIKHIDYVTKFMPKLRQGAVHSVDISAAYWYTAHHLKFISEDLFKEGLRKKYSKKARLIALGALASQPLISDFDGKKYKIIKTEQPITASIFYKCAEVVNDLITAIAGFLGNDFIFYWVDCVYFYEQKNIIKVEKILANRGYKFKSDKIISAEQDFQNKIIKLVKSNAEKAEYNFTKNQ